MWVWIFINRGGIIWAFSAIYHLTHTSPIISDPRQLRKSPDTIKGLNDGHITDLNKAKINTGPVTYDTYPHYLMIDDVPGTYDLLPNTMLPNIWFVYLMVWFLHQQGWVNSNQGFLYILQGLISWPYKYSRKLPKNPPEPWRRLLIFLADTLIKHRWELPVIHYHKILVIYPYPFWVVITLLFSWIIFINNYICILTDSPG